MIQQLASDLRGDDPQRVASLATGVDERRPIVKDRSNATGHAQGRLADRP